MSKKSKKLVDKHLDEIEKFVDENNLAAQPERLRELKTQALSEQRKKMRLINSAHLFIPEKDQGGVGQVAVDDA
jgi:hypothetical protein